MIRRFLRSGLRHRIATGLLAGSALVLAAPAMAAQQAGPVDDDSAEPVATTSVPVVQSIAPSPTRLLNAALARLARDPRDISALLDAGGAALDLGDTDAAIGFLTRAEQVAPGTAGVRARMGIAMLRANQPFEAIRWFDLADQAGFNRVEMATERGLAYDLIGDNAAAQRQYQLALTAGQNDEASRRYALSLVIAGDRRGAELVIQPLLERRDRGAWRVRAFIMAISGQSDEAEGIARATMPADLAAAISPYLRYMPRLTAAQQAAAANLGRFPRAADIGRDDPQIVQYALAHPRAPRVDAALVPQGEALGARGRDDRSKRRRPGKDEKRDTALAAAAPAGSAAQAPAGKPAVSAPWGLQPGTRTAAAAPQQALPAPQFQSLSQPTPSPTVPPAPTPARPPVLSKLDVPPGTPLAPPPTPQPRAVAPTPIPAPPPTQPVAVPPVPKPAVVTPVPAPVQIAAATPPAATPAPAPAPDSAAAPSAAVLGTPTVTGPQLALASPAPTAAGSPAATTAPASQQPAPVPAPATATPPPPPPPPPATTATPPAASAPADFRSAFDGFKPPEQETGATKEAVDLARIEALRESAKAAAAKGKSKDRTATKDRGERPDGPTAVSRTSDQDAAEPAVTRGSKEKPAEKDAKAKLAKDKLALDTDCLNPTDKGKSGKSAGRGKAAPAKGKATSKSGAKSAKGKGAAEAQCPPENGKKAKGKAEPQHASRIWVQVLTGSNRAAMSKEWQRLASTAAALRGRKPSITPWRSNYRLLTGPFASDAEAQAFVEKLRGQGVSSYQWTSPAGQEVDGLGVK
ncbi:SPOR domain-containing protein [Novosphingobium sp.]|uniref:SPOR domain-containing protein n=1 Tax=Novosphingobium sp. TaxID=1874826 RepID=UPI00262ACDB8|nr:SPOR domain-containing protein [Novosphingobium sp.]